MAKEADCGPAHAAPGASQHQAAFELRDGTAEIALDHVETAEGVGRNDAVELVTPRLGNPDRLFSERDSFDELTEVGEGQRQPRTGSDEDRSWTQSQAHTLDLRLEPLDGHGSSLGVRPSAPLTHTGDFRI